MSVASFLVQEGSLDGDALTDETINADSVLEKIENDANVGGTLVPTIQLNEAATGIIFLDIRP